MKKKLTKEQKRQQRKKAIINASYVSTSFTPPFKMCTWDNTKTCLRIIGYDAFEHFGLTHEEADYLTSRGDWTCFVDRENADNNTGNHYALDGNFQGESDEQFIFSTALDVFTSVVAVAVLKGKMTDEEFARYGKLIDKMAVADKEIFKWYFTTSQDFIEYDGDYSDFTITNAVHDFCNKKSEYCINWFLKPYGLSTKSEYVYTTTAY